MPAEHHIDHENNLIITTWEGAATDTEFLEVLSEYQKNILCAPDCNTYNEVFDVSQATEINITIEGLLKIGREASKTDHLFTHKKLAFIVSSDWAFSLVRTYEFYRTIGKKSSKKVSVFKNKDEAIAWAKSNT